MKRHMNLKRQKQDMGHSCRGTRKAWVRLGWLAVTALTRAALADSSSEDPPPFIYVMPLPGVFNTQWLQIVAQQQVRVEPHSTSPSRPMVVPYVSLRAPQAHRPFFGIQDYPWSGGKRLTGRVGAGFGRACM